MSSTLKINKFSYDRGSKNILNNIEVDLQEPRFVAIIGPNGSGKSHLLKAIAGLLPEQNRSNIFIEDRAIEGCSYEELCRKVSWMPQSSSEAFDFSVEDLLDIAGHGLSTTSPRVDSVLDSMGILYLKPKMLSQLSGGEKKLCYVARALLRAGDLVLLDEPDANLDIAFRLRILKFLQQLKGKTILAAMHDVNLAIKYAEELWFMHQGELVYRYRGGEVLDLKKIEEVFSVGVELLHHNGQPSLFFKGSF